MGATLGSAVDGKKQIERSTLVNAPAEAVWDVLADSRLLAQWVPAVDEVTECSIDGEAVGEVRHCSARLAGKSGRMVERCIEFTPLTRIAYIVDDESFGMRKMFDHYGFAINLESEGSERTRVTLETHYTPRNPIYGLLNALMLRRQFRKVCEEIVGGLKTFAESRLSRSGKRVSQKTRSAQARARPLPKWARS
jgi:uncharacterized protein YndB with AHSA1/START domain